VLAVVFLAFAVLFFLLSYVGQRHIPGSEVVAKLTVFTDASLHGVVAVAVCVLTTARAGSRARPLRAMLQHNTLERLRPPATHHSTAKRNSTAPLRLLPMALQQTTATSATTPTRLPSTARNRDTPPSSSSSRLASSCKLLLRPINSRFEPQMILKFTLPRLEPLRRSRSSPV
jgi:hypothetical protein